MTRLPANVAEMSGDQVQQLVRSFGLNPHSTIEESIVEKQPRERLPAFYKRAEAKGVARECLKCGAVRRFSMVNCPVCGEAQFRQVLAKKLDKPVLSNEEKQPAQPSNPEMNSTFNANPEHDPDASTENENVDPNAGAENEPNPILEDDRPLADRTVDELRALAALKEIDLTGLKAKADIVTAIGVALGGVEPEDDPPKED